MNTRGATLICSGTSAVIVVALLISAGQPIFAEDTWWHLAMGRVYAAQGPWLEADPLLFTAQLPPAPASWLAALALHELENAAGFHALRVLHVMLVAGILFLGGRALFRVTGSIEFATVGTALFGSIAGYRLFQLRPELLTILLCVWMVGRVVAPDSRRDTPSIRTVILIAFVFALWANVHAAFLLGPILLAAAAGGVMLAMTLGDRSEASRPARLRWMLAALALGSLATLLNPSGASPHLLYFVAGQETPALAGVTDEWSRFPLFDLPRANLPPSALSWCTMWLLLLATPASLALALRTRSKARSTNAIPLDPALFAIAAASLSAGLLAVRFGWMSLFAMLAIGHGLKHAGFFEPRRNALTLAISATGLVAAVTFFHYGPWPMISRGITQATYSEPYPASKHEAHAVWFLADVEAEGRMFNEYATGNFLGYWLAPKLMTFVNGSLNVPRSTIDDGAVIATRGWQSSESIEAILDRYSVDFFFGTGVPHPPRRNRELPVTTRHLERTDGWIQVFRNFNSAVYLRDHERNRSNLERITRYYRAAGVPFDPHAGGFDPHSAITRAPQWAIDHGLIPRNWAEISQRARSNDPQQRFSSRNRQAGLFAILGAYEAAAQIDRETLSQSPRAVVAAKRLLFCLLQLGDSTEPEASTLAAALTQIIEPADQVATALISAAQNGPGFDPGQRRALNALIPMMTRKEAVRMGAGIVKPAARS